MLEEGREVGGSLWAAGDTRSVVRRVWWAHPLAGAAMAVVAHFVGDWRDATGVVAGTALAMANFRFLHNSLQSILGSGNESAPPGTTMMFVFRWVIVATAAFALYQFGVMSLGGVFAGLCVSAVAVTLEAVYQLASAITHGIESDDTEIK